MFLVVVAVCLLGAGFPESDIRKQLDRLFFSEQYVLDIQVKTSLNSTRDAAPLPGLANVWATDTSKDSYDLLLIIDQGVSNERVRIAQDLVNRHLENAQIKDRVNVSVVQKPMLKVAPPEMLRDPAPAKSAPNPEPAQQPKEKEESLLNFIENKRDLSIKILGVLWAALASLLVVCVIVSRILRGNGAGSSHNTGGRGFKEPSQSEHSAVPSPGDKALGKKAVTKDEIYSKDAAVYKLSQDIVNDCQEHPQKIARILSNWIESSEENVRYAGIFLKNCDVKTVEQICKHLHPADIKKILSNEIVDFDPFSDENINVLERIRGELAMLAAQGGIKERPQPLEFAKVLSETDLAQILADETLDDVALVATQIPAHRLGHFLSSLNEEQYRLLLDKITHVGETKLQDFDQLKRRLQEKASALKDVLFSDESKAQTITQMISNAELPNKQMTLVNDLRKSDSKLYETIRPKLLLASDLLHFPARALRILLQSSDVEKVAETLRYMEIDLTPLREQLVDTSRYVFDEIFKREVSEESQAAAWRAVRQSIRELTESGLISAQEIAAARRKNDSSTTESDSAPEGWNGSPGGGTGNVNVA